MIRQRVAQSLIVMVVVAFIGWGVQHLMAALGTPRLALPWSIPIVLVVLAIVVVILSLPIRAQMKGKRKARVDPFHALRVLALARACIITGAVCMGLGLGTALYLYLLPAGQGGGETSSAFGTLVGGAIAVTGGIIAEQFCKLPPEDDEGTKAKPQVPAMP